MSSLKIITVLLIQLTFIAGCNSISPNNNVKLDSKVKFEIYEAHPASVNSNIGIPEIHLRIITEKIYPCSNYRINTFQNISGGNISIYLPSLNVPDICLTSLGPAIADIPLNLINRKYNLKLIFNGITDNYDVDISDSVIYLNNNVGDMSTPVYYKYFRYPKNSFAYYCGTLIEDKYICDDFLDTLKSYLKLKEFYFPQDGQKPYHDSLGGHYYEMPARFFIYNNDEDFNKIGNILSSYKKNVIKDKQGIGISIVNWMNKSFYSWQY